MKRKIIDEKIERLRYDHEFLDHVNEVIDCEIEYNVNPDCEHIYQSIFRIVINTLNMGGLRSEDVYNRLHDFAVELLHQNERFILEML